MKIFVAHATKSDFKEELYKPIRESELNKKHDFILPQENGKEVITREIIQSCDLVLAEVSHPSTGQGIELGWANIFNVPIICLYKDGATPSNSLSFISNKMLMYTSPENMIEDIIGVLKSYE